MPKISINPKTILILDDDVSFRNLISPILVERGFRVLEADTGKVANATLESESIDLVIVDGNLPDIDGTAWISELRESDNDVPVIFVSMMKLADQSLSLSFDELNESLGIKLVLYKPIIPSLFAEEIESILSSCDIEPKKTDPKIALKQLKEKYARALPQKLARLRDLVLEFDGEDLEVLQEPINLAHKLQGTAGTFGFAELGSLMKEIEGSIRTFTSNGTTTDTIARTSKLIEQAIDHVTEREKKAQSELPEMIPDWMTKARLLVVDKETDFLDQVDEWAKSHFTEIAKACTMDDALQCARSLHLDAAIIDLAMGDSFAFALANELRALPGNEDLPLAFVSAQTGLDRRVSAAHAGASLFIEKPLDEDLFTANVQQLLSQHSKERPKILVVDDDEDFLAYISLMLINERMQVETCSDTTNVLETLDKTNPHLMLLDVVMPKISGFDICRILRSNTRWQHLPIIFLTACNEFDYRLAAFQSGADDYLPKPVIREELLARVELRLEKFRLLRERADKDALSGLLMRRAFIESFSTRMSEALRNGSPITLALIDLDHFKMVNDTHGHLAGDSVLAAFGKLLSRRFRADDLRGRWGGEEFILAFPGDGVETIVPALEKILLEFRGIVFQGESGENFSVSFSSGLAMSPEDGNRLYDLVAAADKRLYEAKRRGRNQVVGNGLRVG